MENEIRIAVLGSANMDLVFGLDRMPREGETIQGSDLALFPGGKGANQACAAARLGGRVAMIGKVGADAFGERLAASLEAAGVDTAPLGISTRPTGCACIYVLPNGENSIVISPGANATVDPETAVSSLGIVPPGGYLLSQLEIPLESVESAFTEAKARGITTILDPAPVRPLPESLLRNVDFLTPNQTEAASLLGRPDWDIRDFAAAESAATGLLALGPACVIVKLGSAGCFVASGEMRMAVPAFRVTAVDTVAAGDVFNGALAVALAEGKPLMDAAVFASAAAAISTTRPGAQASIPSREETNAFLHQQAGAAK